MITLSSSEVENIVEGYHSWENILTTMQALAARSAQATHDDNGAQEQQIQVMPRYACTL